MLPKPKPKQRNHADRKTPNQPHPNLPDKEIRKQRQRSPD